MNTDESWGVSLQGNLYEKTAEHAICKKQDRSPAFYTHYLENKVFLGY